MTQTPMRSRRTAVVSRSTTARRVAAGRTGTVTPPRSSTAADRAYARRRRRTTRISQERLENGGRQIRGALSRAWFTGLVIAVLGCGAGGVLLLSTLGSQTGVQIDRARAEAELTGLDIESLTQQVNDLNATQNIADRAHRQGLGPATGDGPIVVCPRSAACRLAAGPPAGENTGSNATGDNG